MVSNRLINFNFSFSIKKNKPEQALLSARGRFKPHKPGLSTAKLPRPCLRPGPSPSFPACSCPLPCLCRTSAVHVMSLSVPFQCVQLRPHQPRCLNQTLDGDSPASATATAAVSLGAGSSFAVRMVCVSRTVTLSSLAYI